MAQSQIDRQLRECIDAFVEDISALVQAQALEAVSEALGGEPAAGKQRGPGRRSGGESASAALGRAVGKRVRRTQEDINQLANRIVDFINENGPARMEQLTSALGRAAKDLRGPIKVLLEERTLKTKGQKRATEYHPA